MLPDLPRVVDGLIARFRAAVEHEDPRTMANQVQLAEIPAPTAAEQRRATWVAAALARLGYLTRRDDVGNVLASDPLATDAPPVVVCAHLDTVFSDDVHHRIETRNGRWIGPGIGDNARGLAAMLTIARVLRAHHVQTRHPILFAATVGEEGEGDLRGARHLFSHDAAHAHAAFAIDGAGDDRIVTHAIGTRRFRITISGPGGHSWAASQSPNPLHAAADITTCLSRLQLRNAARTTIAVTRLHGGEAVNAIPGSATLDVEMRAPQAAILDAAERELSRLISAALEREAPPASALHGTLSAVTAIISNRPTGAVAEDATPVRASVAATRAIDRFPEFAIASTDANIPLSLGIPAVALGAGGIGGDTHTTAEWFENRSGALGVTRALAAIVTTAGLA